MLQNQNGQTQGNNFQNADIRTWRASRVVDQKRQETVNRQILRRLHGLSAALN